MNIYELTLDEYRATLKGERIPHYYYSREGQIRADHRDAVTNALQLGWHIPDNVLHEFAVTHPWITQQYQTTIDGIK